MHIVGKIDLDTIKKEAKAPKKETLKKVADTSKKDPSLKKVRTEEKVSLTETPAEIQEADEKTAEDKTPAEPVEQTVNGQEEAVEVYKPVIKKLSGLTVVGKIELPAGEEKPAGQQPVKVDDSESDVGRKEENYRKRTGYSG